MTNPRSAALATLITVGALALTAGCGTRNVDDPTPPGPGGTIDDTNISAQTDSSTDNQAPGNETQETVPLGPTTP